MKNIAKIWAKNIVEGNKTFDDVPAKLKEQQSIGLFVLQIDRQITLQSQRLEKLKQIKAACLDKMFV